MIAEEDDEKADAKLSNRSSIAVLISYKGIKLLFPGDCAIHFFEDMLPDKIDIVKQVVRLCSEIGRGFQSFFVSCVMGCHKCS